MLLLTVLLTQHVDAALMRSAAEEGEARGQIWGRLRGAWMQHFLTLCSVNKILFDAM